MDILTMKAEQDAYFNEVIGQNPDGTDIKRGEYKQVVPVNTGDPRVDVYDGPGGKGYVFIETKHEGGKTYEKSTNVGPEEWRTHDWK